MIILRQQLYSLESGGPDKKGSLLRELAKKFKGGAITGGVLGGLVSIVPSVLSNKDPELATAFVAGGIGGGAIFGAIANSITAAWSKRNTENFQKVTMNNILDRILSTNSVVSRYLLEDQDPRKFNITFAVRNGQGIIILNNPSKETVDYFNEELEDIVAENRFADYTSIKTKHGYEVYLTANEDNFCGLLYDLIVTLGIKVNCITDETIDKYVSNK